jgi:hypothetical protein
MQRWPQPPRRAVTPFATTCSLFGHANKVFHFNVLHRTESHVQAAIMLR